MGCYYSNSYTTLVSYTTGTQKRILVSVELYAALITLIATAPDTVSGTAEPAGYSDFKFGLVSFV